MVKTKAHREKIARIQELIRQNPYLTATELTVLAKAKRIDTTLQSVMNTYRHMVKRGEIAGLHCSNPKEFTNVEGSYPVAIPPLGSGEPPSALIDDLISLRTLAKRYGGWSKLAAICEAIGAM